MSRVVVSSFSMESTWKPCACPFREQDNEAWPNTLDLRVGVFGGLDEHYVVVTRIEDRFDHCHGVRVPFTMTTVCVWVLPPVLTSGIVPRDVVEMAPKDGSDPQDRMRQCVWRSFPGTVRREATAEAVKVRQFP